MTTKKLIEFLDFVGEHFEASFEKYDVLTEIKGIVENPFSLSENQKKLVCSYYHCSDGYDRQHPSCELRQRTFIGCGLKKTEKLLELLQGEK